MPLPDKPQNAFKTCGLGIFSGCLVVSLPKSTSGRGGGGLGQPQPIISELYLSVQDIIIISYLYFLISFLIYIFFLLYLMVQEKKFVNGAC